MSCKLQNVSNVISNASTINNDTSLHCSTATIAHETLNDKSIFNRPSYNIFIYAICFSTIKHGTRK